MLYTARRPLAVMAVLLLALSTAWVSGCDDFTQPGSTAPQNTTPAPQSTELLDEVAKPIKVVPVTTLILYDSVKSLSYLSGRAQTIRAAKGGTISTGGFTLTVPPNTLEKDTYVILRPSSLSQCQVEILPTGLKFRPDTFATLRIDYDGTNAVGANTLGAVWLDPSKNAWVRMPNGNNDANSRKYSVPLSHFSYYALAK